MITASHNEFKDNGVKIVNGKGNMISKDEENDLVKYVINNGIINRWIKYCINFILIYNIFFVCHIKYYL